MTQLIINNANKAREMAHSKMLAILLNFVGVPLYIYAYIVNMDNIKSTILFIVALIITMLRTFFWIIRVQQNNRMKEIQIKRNDLELERERLINEEKRVEILERELSIRITGMSKNKRNG